MQMYEVSFQVHWQDFLDIGKVLVCASDNQCAADTVRFHLGLPTSKTVFDVKRIKPSIWQLDRHEIYKQSKTHSSNKKADPKGKYLIKLTAGVMAASESHACRLIGHAVIERSSSDKAVISKSITEYECDISRIKQLPKIADLSKGAIFKKHQFFQGGDTRPR